MSRPRQAAATFVALLAPAAILGSLGYGIGGCYKPHIVSGTLICADGDNGKECPDGFLCGAGNLCYKVGDPPFGGSGGGPGTGGAGGTGGTAAGSGGNTAPRLVGETCLIRNQNQPDQSDNCDDGLLCMNDCATARCYKICTGDADCPQSVCTRMGPGGTPRLCELPFVTCDPREMGNGTCGPGLGCYLLSSVASPSGGNRTVCDCTAKDSGRGQPCSESRDCFRGLLCPLPVGSGAGAGFCWAVCDPLVGCPSGGTCHPYGAKWGYCF